MRLLMTIALAVAACQGQAAPTSTAGEVQSNFENLKLNPKSLTGVAKLHIHAMPLQCKGAPDAVYGRQDGVYYACIGEKEVCSREKDAIPSTLIADFDANMRAHQERWNAYHERRVREGRATDDPQADHKAAIARHQARAAAATQGQADRARGSSVSIQEVRVPDSPTSAASAVRPAPAPAAPSEEQVQSVPLGTSAEEVVRQLGRPAMTISGPSGQLLYTLASGKEAWLGFKNGKLAGVRIVSPQ